MADREQASPASIDGVGSAHPRALLVELAMREFAIVDELRVQWSRGLVAITGETGAGKSIIIDALGAALGDRLDSSWLRAGAARSSVDAVFAGVSRESSIARVLLDMGIDPDDDQLILSRDVQAGRSIARINGRSVPLATAQQVGTALVDVHSQASHLSLARVREHVELLDRYAGAVSDRKEMASAFRAWMEVRREIARIESGERQARREASLLGHEVNEIDAAGITVGEEEELVARRGRLQNALRLRQLARAAYEALQGSDQAPGAIELLGTAASRITEISSLDSQIDVGTDRVVDAVDMAEDLARMLRRYGDAIEEDPEALSLVEERLLLLSDLKRKYGATLDDVLAYRDEAAHRLAEIERGDERLAELACAEREARVRVAEAAAGLSEKRQSVARDLELAVQTELEALGMPGALFVVQITFQHDDRGVTPPGHDAPVACDETGIDRVEFLMSANRGEPPRPLAQVASGGELARFMLALKSALASADETPVLIFDELDQGVGGRLGHVVGEKLWRLGRRHQVLCITHLPQVAAYADAHFGVNKIEVHGRTVTRVARLEGSERVEELAVMLGGPGGGRDLRDTAQRLLDRAEEWKTGSGDCA
ncbi:MAG TPA: DNA repair protein RecN [Chloroflexota bacterium]|nr:DNA repair protein RecN [Chloroflexota bacterium]